MGVQDASAADDKASATEMIPMEKQHEEGKHFVVLDDGITYVGVPRSSISDQGTLCFSDHKTKAPPPEADKCCLLENAHVHAHVHHGEITEDILLEQCLEEACCTLPKFSGCFSPYSYKDLHEHTDGCGHNQIAHGDHYDWLVPLKDGSFLVSHKSVGDAGDAQFFEHGRLVKVGESLGKLKRRPKQLVDIFSFESPKRKGYDQLLPTIVAEVGQLKPPESVKVDIPETALERTVLDVLGICCPSEVPLVKKILEPLPGVKEVSVNVTARTVSVLHDKLLTPEGRLVKALNEARLDASIHRRGELKRSHKWPSPWTVACGILLVVSLFEHLFRPLRWVAIGAVAVGIPPIVLRSYASLRRGILDINILMLIAVGGAIAMGDYEEAASIVFLFTVAEWLEGRSNDRARAALASGMTSGPRNAVIAETGAMIPVEDVAVGTILAVKAGEMVPVDGVVVSGKCSVEESSLTGESKPVEKTPGDAVWAGTLNLAGFITIKATALAGDSASARMTKLVEEAQSKRSPTEQLVARFAKYYTPALVVAAILIAVIPLAVHARHESRWLYKALVLLVVACPCALVISTPIATACGLHQAARLGVVVKGGNFLETLALLKSLAMDKTGTLTEGHFRVSNIVLADEKEERQQVLRWIASVESQSSHPMASALVSYCRLQGVESSTSVSDFRIVEGEGVSAVVEGHLVEIGNARLAERRRWGTIAGDGLSDEAATVGWVGVDHRLVAMFSIQDHLREEAVEAIASLKRLGIRIDILTGDNRATAEAVQKKLGGGVNIHAELLPNDKVRIIQELKAEHSPTGMIGDGINDAPALAASDVGFAMGLAGSAMAMETADVFLMTDDLRKLAATVKLARQVRRKVLQNVVVSILVKVAIVAISFAGYARLWAAVLADVGTCMVVILNSMMLLRKTDKKKGGDHQHNHQHAHDHQHDHGQCQGDGEESKEHGHSHGHRHFHLHFLDMFRRSADKSGGGHGECNKGEHCQDETCGIASGHHHSQGLLHQHRHSSKDLPV